MTIRGLVTWSATAMMIILALCVVVGTKRINEIRMGGPIQTETQQASDLIADILPPPEYVIEPYLEASMLMRNPALVSESSTRLAKLHADYDARHNYWQTANIDPAVRVAITKGTHESAARFWEEMEGRFLPAARAGDLAKMERSFGVLTRIYAEHRTKVDAAVSAATAYQARLRAHADERLGGAMLMLGGLAVLLVALIAGFCSMVLLRVVKPIGHVTAHMQQMAKGITPVDSSDAQRSDEIGEVARALQGIVAYVEENARETSAREMATQQQIVSALGIGLSKLKQGVLHHRIHEVFPSQYEQLREDFNEAVAAMHDAIRQVTTSVESLNSSAGEISAATQDLSQRTENQAASLEQTAARMGELTERVKDTADAANAASITVGSAEQEAQTNAEMMRSTVEAMSGIERSAEGIARITQVIDNLAFQTNLLSLNASVEAARAGEAGKSFAVVAEEVRALAQRSAAAAMEIKELIDESNRQVGGGVKLVGQTGEALETIMGKVTEVSGLISRIATAAGEQADGLSQINGAMGGMDRMTQQNAAMGEECNAAARMLHHEADRLSTLVGRFEMGTERDMQRAALAPHLTGNAINYVFEQEAA